MSNKPEKIITYKFGFKYDLIQNGYFKLTLNGTTNIRFDFFDAEVEISKQEFLNVINQMIDIVEAEHVE